MAEKHKEIKEMFSIFSHKENTNKTALKFHFILFRMAKIIFLEKIDRSNWQRYSSGEHSSVAGGSSNM